MNLAQSSSDLLLGATISQPYNHYILFYFLIQTFDPQQLPAIQSRAFNDPHGDGDSLACFDRSDPLPVDDSSPFSAPSPFIPSMHFFIGRIWDRGLKGVAVCLIFSTDTLSLHCSWWCTTRVMLGMACWRKAAVPLPLCVCATCPSSYSATNYTLFQRKPQFVILGNLGLTVIAFLSTKLTS